MCAEVHRAEWRGEPGAEPRVQRAVPDLLVLADVTRSLGRNQGHRVVHQEKPRCVLPRSVLALLLGHELAGHFPILASRNQTFVTAFVIEV